MTPHNRLRKGQKSTWINRVRPTPGDFGLISKLLKSVLASMSRTLSFKDNWFRSFSSRCLCCCSRSCCSLRACCASSCCCCCWRSSSCCRLYSCCCRKNSCSRLWGDGDGGVTMDCGPMDWCPEDGVPPKLDLGGLGDGEAGGRPNVVLNERADPDLEIGCWPRVSLIWKRSQKDTFTQMIHICQTNMYKSNEKTCVLPCPSIFGVDD